MASSDITPFKIAIPDASLDALHQKLSTATLPLATDFADDTTSGVSLAEIRRLLAHWQDGFDWRAQERKLNSVPQFTTAIEVDGFGTLDVHFVHQRAAREDSIPLLFVHGWPGCFLEVLKVLPLLTNPKDPNLPSFHVVAPSLPNFGFSDLVTKKGFSIPQHAETVHKLMLKLGYNKYASQGGDWGAAITRSVAALYPTSCLATHNNGPFAQPSFLQTVSLVFRYYFNLLPAAQSAALARSTWYFKKSSGYFLQQSTKPSTLAFGLADSPTALLAWVLEKLREWTDDYPWTDDEILTWISVYYFSKPGPAASVRIYYEVWNDATPELKKSNAYVPGVLFGVSYYAKDLLNGPPEWSNSMGPIVFRKAHAKGGHFAAYEQPEQFVEDLRDMFGEKGGAYKIARLFAAESD